MAPGQTGCMTADLAPGRYAFIAGEYGSRGVVHEFRVQ